MPFRKVSCIRINRTSKTYRINVVTTLDNGDSEMIDMLEVIELSGPGAAIMEPVKSIQSINSTLNPET